MKTFGIQSSGDTRRGTAIVAALVVVTVVAVLSVAYLQLSMSKNREQRASVDAKRAFYIAEAGLSEAFAGLAIGKSGNVANSTLPARYANGAFWVEAKDETNGRMTLKSTGMCGTGRTSVSVVVEHAGAPIGSLGVFGRDTLTVNAGAQIDSYDSSQAPVNPGGGGQGGLLGGVGGLLGGLLGGAPPPEMGRVGSNENIVVRGTRGGAPTTIHADTQPGVDGSVIREGNVEVTGSTAPRAAPAVLPPIEVPSLPVQSDVDHAARTTLNLGAREAQFGHVRVRSGATAEIAGPATLVIDKLQIDAGATLRLDSTNGKVKVYVRDWIDLAPSSTLASVDEDATGVSFLVPATESVDRDGDRIADAPVRIGSSGTFYGIFYAPETEVTWPSTLELFGSIAAGQLSLAPGAQIHVDRALVDAQDDDQARPNLMSWRLVELPRTPLVENRLDPLSVLRLNNVDPPQGRDAHYDYGTNPSLLAPILNLVFPRD
ncbi:MAG: hypothetical protein ACKVWV_15460 [Planctomycetota bacterium]